MPIFALLVSTLAAPLQGKSGLGNSVKGKSGRGKPAKRSTSERRELLGGDAELVKRACAGEQKAFELLVARHTRLAGSVAISVISDYHAAMDVVQEAFVKVLANLHKLDQPERFKPWLRNVVRTTALDALRRKKVAGRSGQQLPGQDEESQPLPSSALSPEALLEQSELREQVRAAVGELPETQREVVVLRYLNGLSYEEIAAATGLTIGTIESRLFRARTNLRQELKRRFQ